MNSAASTALDELALRCGIEPDYRDVRGDVKKTSAATRRALLRAMDVEADDEAAAAATLAAVDQAEWDRSLPPVFVLHRTGQPFRVAVTLPAGTPEVAWRVTLEDTSIHEGSDDFAALTLLEHREAAGAVRERHALTLPPGLPNGYHELALRGHSARAVLIISPGRCWLPPAIRTGERLWWCAGQGETAE